MKLIADKKCALGLIFTGSLQLLGSPSFSQESGGNPELQQKVAALKQSVARAVQWVPAIREAVLQRSEARQILIDYWMAHSNPDRYGKQLVEDVEYRQEQVKKVGVGFELPPSLFGLRGPQKVGDDRNKEAA
jgi:hypothetical protein